MKLTGWVLLLYALIIFLGGIFGYVSKESVPSLVMGVIFAAALSVGSFMVFNGKQIGFIIGAAATALLFLFFCSRFILSFKLFPGVIAAISLAVLIFLFLNRMKAPASK